jgi:ABC-2 type transport system permease protein
LLIKEWFIFRRDFSQWGQFLHLMALVALYVVQVRDISFPDQAYRIRSIISFFNILLLGFVQATLALRYAFPSMSLEGTAFWAVCKSPVGISRYFLGKYTCHFLWILAIGEIMTVILNRVLHLGQPFSGIAMVIVAILSLGFTSCTVGLGAVYPRFDAAGAADVSSSAGALVSMALTLSYLAFSAAILARLIMNILPMEGASFLDGHGWEGVLIIAAGFGCSWMRMALPGSAEGWLVQHLPVSGVWDILDINSTILLTFFLLLQVAAIVYPARAGMRQLEEITG